MTTTLKPSYAASAAITITSAATLASLAAAGCLAIDNTSNLYLDAMVTLNATIASGVIAADKLINIWGAASEDGSAWPGTNIGSLDNYVGTDAAVTLQTPTVYSGPFVQPTPNSNGKSVIIIPSVCALLGLPMLPRKWGLIVENRSGLAFTAFTAAYTGINPQNV